MRWIGTIRSHVHTIFKKTLWSRWDYAGGDITKRGLDGAMSSDFRWLLPNFEHPSISAEIFTFPNFSCSLHSLSSPSLVVIRIWALLDFCWNFHFFRFLLSIAHFSEPLHFYWNFHFPISVDFNIYWGLLYFLINSTLSRISLFLSEFQASLDFCRNFHSWNFSSFSLTFKHRSLFADISTFSHFCCFSINFESHLIRAEISTFSDLCCFFLLFQHPWCSK